jgi:hypothetical protein
MEMEGWKTMEGKATQRKKQKAEADRKIDLFLYLFLINACNLKVMATFIEFNDRNLSIILGPCWTLSQY